MLPITVTSLIPKLIPTVRYTIPMIMGIQIRENPNDHPCFPLKITIYIILYPIKKKNEILLNSSKIPWKAPNSSPKIPVNPIQLQVFPWVFPMIFPWKNSRCSRDATKLVLAKPGTVGSSGASPRTSRGARESAGVPSLVDLQLDSCVSH